MKNYAKSDFAVNKYADGIVYLFADGTVEYTLTDYLRDNPDKSEADFAELKTLSDEIYEEQARDENRQTYKNVSIHSLEETTAFALPSPEHTLIDLPEQAEMKRQRRDLAAQALETLTETQRRRYVRNKANDLSTWKIAKIEGVNQSKIMKSVVAAEKKINKFLAVSKKWGFKTPDFLH